MSKKRTISIVGAGLVGSLLSLFLVRRGYRVSIYERRPDMRVAGAAGGRSINLALSDRGIRALNAVGVMDSIREIAIPMHGRFLHHTGGKTGFQAYGKEGQFINSVSRSELNIQLMNLANRAGVEIHFDQKLEEINWEKNELIFSGTGGDITAIGSDMIVAADGAFSAGRLQYMLNNDRFDYNQYYLDFGYKELHIPPGVNGRFLLEKNALHIWPRGNYMLIALPNIDGSFTCTLFFPFEGDPSFETLSNEKAVEDFFEKQFPDAKQLMPTLLHDFFHNPTSSLVTVKCYPWVKEDKFFMIGDASHAIVPFFGQGMNSGFEDCVVLDELLEKHGEDWVSVLKEFQELRKPDADAIADMAVNNFIEMRDRVGDPRFLLQKKIEARLYEQYPDKWIPAYSQVTFRPDIRYSEAMASGRKQESIMKEVMKMENIEESWNDPDLHRQIIDRL